MSIFLVQSLLIKVSAKIFKKNLAPLIFAQFSETLTRPLMGIRKISNTRGDYCSSLFVVREREPGLLGTIFLFFRYNEVTYFKKLR